MAIDCFKGVKIVVGKDKNGNNITIEDKFNSLIEKGMTDEQVRDIGTDVVMEHFAKLEKDMAVLNKSVGIKTPKKPTPAPVKVKKSAEIAQKKRTIEPAKPKEVKKEPTELKTKEVKKTTPEIVEVDKQLKQALKNIKAAKTALTEKIAKLGKTFEADQKDLFGERKSDQTKGLFDERIDTSTSKRAKATEAERAALDKAQKEYYRLQAKRAELEITREVTEEIDFEQNDVKAPESTSDQRKKAIDDWFEKASNNKLTKEEGVKQAKEILKEHFVVEVNGQKYVAYPDLSKRKKGTLPAFWMEDAFTEFFELFPANTKIKKGSQFLDPLHSNVYEVAQVDYKGKPTKIKTVYFQGRKREGKPFPYGYMSSKYKWDKKMPYLPFGFVAKTNGRAETADSFLDNLERKLDQLDNDLAKFGRETLGVNIAIAPARTAIIAMKAAVKTVRTTAELIEIGLNAIRGTKWYQRLSAKDKASINEKTLMDKLEEAIAVHNAITPEQSFEMIENAYEQSEEALNSEPKAFKEKKKKASRAIIKRLSDRQFVPKKLMDEVGARLTKALMINAHGSSGFAKRIFDEAYDKIYKGLSTESRKTLDKIIVLERVIAIDNNRAEKGLSQIMHPLGLDADTATKALEVYKKKLGDEKYNDISNRAKEYFKAYDQILDAKHANGLINDAVYESLKGINYQPRYFLQHITDYEGNVNLGSSEANNSNTGGLSQEQIRSLDEGSMQNLLMQSEWLLATSVVAATKAMSINKINRHFIKNDYPEAKKKYDELQEKINEGRKPTEKQERFIEYFEELDSKIINNPIIGNKLDQNPELLARYNELQEYIYQGYTLSNEAQVELQELEELKRKPVFKYSSSPKPNFKKAYWYDDVGNKKGVRQEFFIEENLHEDWFDSAKGFLSPKAKSYISTWSGSSLLKGIATGNNPAFFLVNTPRDFLFTSVFSDQYSIIVPKAMMQVAKDAVSGSGAILRYRKGERGDNLLNIALEHGLDMAFLSTQGRLNKGSDIAKYLKKLFAIMGMGARAKDKANDFFDVATLRGLQTSSEIVFRLALLKRSIKNELKARGYTTIADIKDTKTRTAKEITDEIYDLGVANARSILDFNQGGTWSKDAEAGIPYFNTAVQGTRVAYDAFQKNPGIISTKVVQAAAIGTSIIILAAKALISFFKGDDDDTPWWEIWFDSMAGISNYQKMMYFNIPTGRKNAKGEYHVIRIAKNHQLTPLFAFTDALAYNALAYMYDKEMISWGTIGTNVFDAFNTNVSPIGLYNTGKPTAFDGLTSAQAQNATQNPILKAMLTYFTGIDFYRDQPLSRDVNQVERPLEGQSMTNVEDFYKKLGREHNISPVRMKAFIEAFITQPTTNPFIGMAYGLVDYVASDDKTVDGMFKEMGRNIAKSSVNRVSTYTNNFNRSINNNKEFEKELYDLGVKEGFNKLDQKDLARKFTEGKMTWDQFDKELDTFEPRDQESIMSRVDDYERLKGVVDRNIIDIKHGGSIKRKAFLILKHYGDIYDGSPESDEVLRQMELAKGILTESVIDEYNKQYDKLKD